ncbi:hypothetical protein D9M68_671770 [compost metagenome]
MYPVLPDAFFQVKNVCMLANSLNVNDKDLWSSFRFHYGSFKVTLIILHKVII